MADIAELRARLTATAADLKKGFADASSASDSLGASFDRLKDNSAGVNQAVEGTEQGLASLKATSAGLSSSLEMPALADAARETAALDQNVQKLTERLDDASRGLSRLDQVPAGIAESGRAADATAGALSRAASSAGTFANASSVLGRELVVVASGGSLTSEGIARLALTMGEAAVAAARLTAAKPAQTANEIVQVFSLLASINPARTISDVATEAARLATTNPAAPLVKIAEASARLAAANPAATMAEIAAKAEQILVAGTPAVSVIGQLGAALVRFSPLAIAAGIAYGTFSTAIATGNAKIAIDLARVKTFTDAAFRGIEKLKDQGREATFELSIAGLSAFEQGVARTNRAIDKLAADAKGGIIPAGTLDASKAQAFATAVGEAMKEISVESQRAGQELQKNMRAGFDGALSGFHNLEAGIIGPTEEMQARFRVLGEALQIRPSEETFAGLRALGESLDFKGPIAELATFQAALDANAGKVREVAEQAGLGESLIQDEIKKTSDLMKDRFKEDVKLKLLLDTSEVETKAVETLANLNALAPVTTSLVFSPDTLARLLSERSTILSRIADAPTAVIKLEARTDLTNVDKEIAAERAKQEADPITITANADTSAAEEALRRLREEASKPLGVGNLPFFKETGGPAASGQEIVGQVSQFKAELAAALSSGNAETVRALEEGAAGFVANFGAGIRKLAALSPGSIAGGGQENVQAARAIAELTSILRGFGVTGAAPAVDLVGAFRDFTLKQQEQINLQRNNVAASNQTVDAIRTLDRSVVTAGRNSANDLARATGAA